MLAYKKAARIIPVLFMLSLKGFSQTVSIQDLIDKSTCKDTACFNAWILKTGFSKNRIIDKPEGKTFRYLSDEKFPRGSTKELKAQNQVSFSVFRDGSTGAAVGTSVEHYYDELISELGALKFEEGARIDDGAGTVTLVYSSPQYPEITVKLQSFLFSQEGAGQCTFHDFQVVRNP